MSNQNNKTDKQSIKIKKRRPIIDKVVEDRKYLHPKEYETVLQLPIGLIDVADYDNEISLKDNKSDTPDGVDFVAALIQKELVILSGDAKPELIIKGKKYNIEPLKYSIIRAVALSSISRSDIIGNGFADALTDWYECSGKRIESIDSLYGYVYVKAYDILESALKLIDVVDEDPLGTAINQMKG